MDVFSLLKNTKMENYVKCRNEFGLTVHWFDMYTIFNLVNRRLPLKIKILRQKSLNLNNWSWIIPKINIFVIFKFTKMFICTANINETESSKLFSLTNLYGTFQSLKIRTFGQIPVLTLVSCLCMWQRNVCFGWSCLIMKLHFVKSHAHLELVGNLATR